MKKNYEIIEAMRSTQLHFTINDISSFSTTIDKDLEIIGRIIPSINGTYKFGRGGNHIWIANSQNERIAAIFYN